MATNFNVSPYFDDFSEDKNFHKVLFRPAFAVQARELTQLQSILQNQVKRFGDHMFKDGAQVIPGELSYTNRYHFAKLSALSTSTAAALIGTVFTGGTNNVQAEVLNATEASTTQAATIYLKYTKTATTGTINRFVAGESLTGDSGETATVGTDNVTLPIDSTAIGTGSAINVEAGIYYIDGFFVKNSAQTLILEPYFVNPSFRVGWTVTETFVTPEADTTLTDNATGSTNINAPGAHRHKIVLTLTKKELDATDDDNFVELMKIDNGNVLEKVIKTDYNLLADTLARRTFDESGNYVVQNFDIDIREHYFSSEASEVAKFGRGIYRGDSIKYGTVANPLYEINYTEAQSKARLAVGMGVGKAYVGGYELETIATKYVTVDKARDFETVNNTTVGMQIGNFVDVTKIYGQPDVDTISGSTEAYKEVRLYKEATATRGTQNAGAGTDIHDIGIALPRFFEYKSGTVGASASNTSSVYKLGLFNISTFTHLRTNSSHSLTTGEIVTGGTSGATGIVESVSTSVSKTLSAAAKSSSALTVTTSATHGLSVGQRVTFTGVGGMTNINDTTFTVATIASTTQFTIAVNSSSFSSFTSGGTVSTGIAVVSNTKGTFAAGETITGGTSTNTAVISADTNQFKSVQAYDFKNTKQVYQAGTPTFTADTVLTSNTVDGFDESQKLLSGTMSIAETDTAVVGLGTKFTTELIVGDTIVFTDNTGETLTGVVAAIISNTSLTLATATLSLDVTTSSPIERRRTKLQNIDENTLVFDMPESTVKTLKTADNDALTDTTFTIRRQFVATLTGDGIGIFNTGANESFDTLASGDYALMHITAGSSAGAVGETTTLSGNSHEGATIFTRGSTNTQLTIDLGSNYGGSQVKLIATITRSVAGEKAKTLNSSSTTTVATAALAQSSSISLGKADVSALNSVFMAPDFSTNATTSHVDITDRFNIDDGQRDNFYDIGSIKIKPGAQAPTGRLLINFDFFSHGTGDYFSVDSYSGIDYENIPSFFSAVREKTIQLRDAIDFRPRVADDSDVVGFNLKDTIGSKNFVNTGSVSVDIPKPGTNFRADFEFYLSRIDAIYLTTMGQFKQAKGSPAVDPQRPDIIDTAMLLAYLRLPAYTFNTSDVTITPIDNRRYTMRDIGKLESRIKNLEYYTSLSLLEQETLNLEIVDANGFNRFKNGFLVDTFKGHNVGDTTSADYQCAIDLKDGVVRPRCHTDQLGLTELATTDTVRTSAGYQKTGDLITLPYTEVEHISNLGATTTTNINPFAVFKYYGNMKLTPEVDEWKDTKTSPDLVVNNDLLYNNIKDIPNPSHRIGSTWNEWQNNWTGTFVESTSSGNQKTTTSGRTGTGTRTGLKRELTSQVVNQSFGERLVDLSYVPFIRAKTITFTVTGLKPLSNHFAYFEEQDVNAYVTPTGGSLGGQLVADANGSLSGTFAIPKPSVSGNPKWRCGERVFKITDSQSNFRTGEYNESFASAKYRAQGLLVTEQETVYATRVPDVVETKLLDETSLREVTDSVTYYSGSGSSSNHNRGGNNDEPSDRDRDGIPDYADPDPDDSRVRNMAQLKNREEAAKVPPWVSYDTSPNTGAHNKNSGCFLPGTLVTMADGSTKPIEQIDLQDNVAVGGFVFATGKFLIDNLYDYKGIKVAGSHMVNEDDNWVRVENSKHGKSLGDDDHVVYVFGSQNRRIKIGDTLFTDYFEVDGQKMLETMGDKYFDNWEKNVHIEGTEEYLNNESKTMGQR